MKNLYLLILLGFSLSMVLKSQTKPDFYVQLGHTNDVFALAFSPDSRFALSGSNDKTVKLWDINSGKEIRTFTGHSASINSVAFSPDGKYAISGSGDKTIKLWDIATGCELKSFSENSMVWTVAFSPDGKSILSGSRKLILWNAVTGEELKTFTGHTNSITTIAYSKDGKTALTGSTDKIIKLWDLEKGVEIKSFLGHTKGVFYVAFSPDEKNIFSGSIDKTFKTWDIDSGKEIKSFICPDIVTSSSGSGINSIAISPDGKLGITGVHFNDLKFWDLENGKLIKKIEGVVNGHSKGIYFLAFSPDGKLALSGSKDKTIKLWDIETLEEVRTFKGHSSEITSVAFSNNGKFFVSGSADKTIKLFEISSGIKLKNIGNGIYDCGEPSQIISHTSISPDGKQIASASYGRIIVWDINSAKCIKSFYGGYVTCITYTPDGKYLISGYEDYKVKFWDAKSVPQNPYVAQNPYFTIDEKKATLNSKIYSLAVSKDGKYLATSSSDGSINLYEIKSLQKIKTFSDHNSSANSLCFSPNGAFIISGSSDNTIKLWDIKNGTVSKSFDVLNMNYNLIACSNNGKYIASVSNDYTLKLLDIDSGKEIKLLSGHLAKINSVTFSPDDKFILSGSADNTTRLWNINDGSWTSFLAGSGDEANNWIAFTSDGYWDGSTNCGELIAMVRGTEDWNIDQFAVLNNRPDLVLKQLNIDNKELSEHYYLQWQKRLRKLGFVNTAGIPDETMLSKELHQPESMIINKKINDKFIDLDLQFKDDNFKLRNYNVFVNDVPIYGAYGKPLTGSLQKLSERIELTKKINKIEVSCVNDKGTESLRRLVTTIYKESVPANLYFLAFGVSKYQNPEYNLAFADKDALDLSATFETYIGKGFENVYTKVLTNEQVTPENIKAAKDFVKNAKPDDTFILFIAGHGIHDTDPEATYYYLTYNTDLKNLKGTAADFETIEDLLQGIPPRNKLFLMDACESGEIDEEDEGVMLAAATVAGIASRGFKATSTQPKSQPKSQSQPKRSYLFQKDRYIYNDLLRRSGAIVFSSSKGGELSYERSDIKNGLFTEYIMKALTTPEADKDKNRIISTDELREYVSAQVAKASGDLQHPTVDRDNIYQKFGFKVR